MKDIIFVQRLIICWNGGKENDIAWIDMLRLNRNDSASFRSPYSFSPAY